MHNRLQHLGGYVIFLLYWLTISVTVSWATQGQFDIPLKDRSGKQVGSFSYKESHALVVGIGDYNGGWPLLPGVKRDVEKVTQALENNGFHVVVKQNLDHTELEKTFRDFILQYGLAPENRLLLYFAGHGYTLKNTYDPNDPTQWTGVIVARNAPLPTQEITSDFRAKTLPIDRFASMARDIQSRHALFIFDSCFSGARGFSLFVPSPDDLVQGVTAKTGEYVRQFISSGSADQQVPDVSAFRKHFILALEGEADRNRDGYVAGSELGIFLQEKVMGDTERQQTPQFGKISDSRLNKGEFLFPLTPPTAAACVSTSLPPHIPSPVVNNLGMEFVAVPAAELRMGTDEIPTLRPSHKVTISQPFYIGKYEVTQAQWRAVMKSNPSRFADLGDGYPVEQVSWDQCQEFCRRVSQQTGRRVRLPSESEWEYACRAGTTTDHFFGNNAADLPRYAWQGVTADGLRAEAWPADLPQPANWNFKNTETTQPVGRKLPNGWGLYDMIGNVYEWCQDERAAPGQRYVGSSNDGLPRAVAARGADRAARGGSWGSQYMNEMRGSHNIGRPAGTSRDDIGLRVVVEVLAVRG